MLNLKVPAPLRAIGEASKRNGTDKMTSEQIDEVIKEGACGEENIISVENTVGCDGVGEGGCE